MTTSYDPAQDNQLLDTIRCHFQDLADTYPHQVSPWGRRHALWWWLGHIASNSSYDDGRLGCLLLGLVRSLHFHKKPIYSFVQLHPLKRDCEDAETLALADFILHLLWKHCSTASTAAVSFPFFNLVCMKPGHHDVFSSSTFLGLRNAGQIRDWKIEWTERGHSGYRYWQSHPDTLEGIGPLVQRLISPIRATDDQVLPPVPAPTKRRSRRLALRDERRAARVVPRRGRPKPPCTDDEYEPRAKRLRRWSCSAPSSPHASRLSDAEPNLTDTMSEEPVAVTHQTQPPAPSPPPPRAQMTASVPPAAAGLPRETGNVDGRMEGEGERAKALAEVQLLDAKERKIAAQRQLIQANEDVRRARARLLALSSSLGPHLGLGAVTSREP